MASQACETAVAESRFSVFRLDGVDLEKGLISRKTSHCASLHSYCFNSTQLLSRCRYVPCKPQHARGYHRVCSCELAGRLCLFSRRFSSARTGTSLAPHYYLHAIFVLHEQIVRLLPARARRNPRYRSDDAGCGRAVRQWGVQRSRGVGYCVIAIGPLEHSDLGCLVRPNACWAMSARCQRGRAARRHEP